MWFFFFFLAWMNKSIWSVNFCEGVSEDMTMHTSQSARALDVPHCWKLKAMSISKCQASFSFVSFLSPISIKRRKTTVGVKVKDKCEW